MASRASVDARLFTWPSDRSEASALPIFYSLATGSSGDSAGVGTSEIEPPRLRRLSLASGQWPWTTNLGRKGAA